MAKCIYIQPHEAAGVCRFVVTPKTVEDVVTAVQFAADHCLKVHLLTLHKLGLG